MVGLKVAIDDVGTGFSSLSMLRHLQADRLKIDRCFIQGLEHDQRIAQMVVQQGKRLSVLGPVTAQPRPHLILNTLMASTSVSAW
ncbi:MAG: EAL domain-containing protein [Aquabacterium sp.]